LRRLIALGRRTLVPEARLAQVLGHTGALFEGLGEERHAPVIALVGPLAEELRRLACVGSDTFAIALEKPEAADALWIALLCGFRCPADRAGRIAADSRADREGLGEVELAHRIAALGGAAEPVVGLDLVLGHAAPKSEADPELILCADMAERARLA